MQASTQELHLHSSCGDETRLFQDNYCQTSNISRTLVGNNMYRKTSSISRTKFQNLNDSCPLLQLSLPNPLKPGVKLRMKM